MGSWMITEDERAMEQTMSSSGTTPGSLDSDEAWVTLLKNANRRYLSSQGAYLLGALNSDPKSYDIRRANLRLVLEHLQRSYTRRSETWIWAILVFTMSALMLSLLIGVDLAIMFGLLTSLGWTVVHRVRRL